MSFLGQFFFPNFYDPGSVRTHRDMLSRTEAMAAALARDGELIGGTPAAMEDIRHRTLAALDTAEHPAGVRARTDALLARAAGAPDSALQDLLGRGGTVKLFLRLAETISRIERDPAGVWQAYRPLMEDWLTRM